LARAASGLLPVNLFRRFQLGFGDLPALAVEAAEEAALVALCSTWISTVSPSQSNDRSFTTCTWPLDSPFIQNFWRERLQNQVLRVSMVFSSEARFIQAIMSTRPVDCCWMIAGMRPSALNLS
jgi:hypothetical protein